MDWDTFVDAATQTSWLTYVGTSDADGSPHVAVVAPGFTKGTVWFATRRQSRKYRNLMANPRAAFHWPVGMGTGPGELAAWGSAELHDSEDERRQLWSSGVMPYDLTQFFQTPDNPDLVFVEAPIRRARLLGPDFVARVWVP
jgi:general stress protein 26